MHAVTHVYISPLSNPDNRFTDLHDQQLRAFGLQTFSLRPALISHWKTARRDKVAVLHWYEDRVANSDSPLFELTRSLLVLVLLRLRMGRIVWFRHNARPHRPVTRPRLQRALEWALAASSHLTVTMRPVAHLESLVVPHPVYPIGPSCEHVDRDIDFLYFGRIRRNKGVVELLREWPVSRRMVMFGEVADPQLLAELEGVIVDRRLDVEWTKESPTNEVLDALLSRAKYVIVPHYEDTMYVSGAFYHAASAGANVLVAEGAFAQYVSGFDFVQKYRRGQIQAALGALSYVSPARVRGQIADANGTGEAKRAWLAVFRRLDIALPPSTAKELLK